MDIGAGVMIPAKRRLGSHLRNGVVGSVRMYALTALSIEGSEAV